MAWVKYGIPICFLFLFVFINVAHASLFLINITNFTNDNSILTNQRHFVRNSNLDYWAFLRTSSTTVQIINVSKFGDVTKTEPMTFNLGGGTFNFGDDPETIIADDRIFIPIMLQIGGGAGLPEYFMFNTTNNTLTNPITFYNGGRICSGSGDNGRILSTVYDGSTNIYILLAESSGAGGSPVQRRFCLRTLNKNTLGISNTDLPAGNDNTAIAGRTTDFASMDIDSSNKLHILIYNHSSAGGGNTKWLMYGNNTAGSFTFKNITELKTDDLIIRNEKSLYVQDNSFIHIVYTNGNNLTYMRKDYNADNFTSYILINNVSFGDYQIVPAVGNKLFIFYSNSTTNTTYFILSLNNGQTWTTPSALTTRMREFNFRGQQQSSFNNWSDVQNVLRMVFVNSSGVYYDYYNPLGSTPFGGFINITIPNDPTNDVYFSFASGEVNTTPVSGYDFHYFWNENKLTPQVSMAYASRNYKDPSNTLLTQIDCNRLQTNFPERYKYDNGNPFTEGINVPVFYHFLANPETIYYDSFCFNLSTKNNGSSYYGAIKVIDNNNYDHNYVYSPVPMIFPYAFPKRFAFWWEIYPPQGSFLQLNNWYFNPNPPIAGSGLTAYWDTNNPATTNVYMSYDNITFFKIVGNQSLFYNHSIIINPQYIINDELYILLSSSDSLGREANSTMNLFNLSIGSSVYPNGFTENATLPIAGQTLLSSGLCSDIFTCNYILGLLFLCIVAVVSIMTGGMVLGLTASVGMAIAEALVGLLPIWILIPIGFLVALALVRLFRNQLLNVSGGV